MERATLTTVAKIRADRVDIGHIVGEPWRSGWWVVVGVDTDAHGAVTIEAQRTAVAEVAIGRYQSSSDTATWTVSTWHLFEIQVDTPTSIYVGGIGVPTSA